MATGTLRFSTLGPLEVWDDDRPLDLGRPKQRAVLVTLLLNANNVVSVDRFSDVLWPDGPVPDTTGNLAVYIANLRRLLEPDRPARTPPQRILTRAPGYLLRVGPGEHDAGEFERLAALGRRHAAEGRPRAARAAFGEALGLWRGRALEEFASAELEAARLERLRLSAIEDRIKADLQLGAHADVVGDLERLVLDQPLQECLVGLLMLALYRSGRQGEALRAYTSARERLSGDLGIEPGADLRRLEAGILAQSPELDWRPPPPEGPAPPLTVEPSMPDAIPAPVFVGRAAELAVLDGALSGAGGGPAAVVLVAGEPGIGKTRLVHEAAGRAAAQGSVVVWGRCEEGDGAPPFWPWIQVVRALLAFPDTDAVRAALGADAGEIGRLVPEVKELVGNVAPPPPLDPASARYRFFEAVAGVLARMADQRRLAVIVDDLHWADPPSLELAGYLARHLAEAEICLILTYRDVDPAPETGLTEVLAGLARLPGRRDMMLQGLSEDEVAQFVASEAGAEIPAGLVATVWDRAGGNPFFVGELTRLLVGDKALSGAASAAGVPWAVRQVVSRRMDRLPTQTQQLLGVAAVAGNDFDLMVVARAAGVDLDQALDQVDVAVAAGLVIEQPEPVGRLRFSHALVREAIYQELTQLRRARLHGLVADALEETGSDRAQATEVAHHRYAAVPVSGAVPALAAAGRAAAAAQEALAHEVAEDHLRKALALVGTLPAGPERDGHELDVQVSLAGLLSMVKGVAAPAAARAWERATELCRAVEDQHRLVLSLWGLLTFAWASGDMAGARALAQHMLQLRRSSSDPAVTVTAHLGLGLVAVCCGDIGDGAAHLAAGKELADAVPEDALEDATFGDLRVQVDSWLSLARHLQGDHEEGARLVDAALVRARAMATPFTVATALCFAVCADVLQGRAEHARRLAEELIAQTDRLQLADFTYHGRVVRAWALAYGESPADEVLAALDALPSALTAGIRPWHPFWLALTAESWQRVGRPTEAWRLVEEAQSEVDAMGSSFSAPDVLRLRGELLAALEPDRRAEAVDLLHDAAERAGAQGAVALRDRALAAAIELQGAGPPGTAR